MGLFNWLFGNKPQKTPQGFYETLTAYAPTFSSWDGEVYRNELVRAAVDARARNISKLNVEVIGSAKPYLHTRMKASPNEWQTWGQFLYRVSTILDCDGNAFICPVLNEYGNTIGYYPIKPSTYQLVQVNDRPYVRFQFPTGKVAAVELTKLGIMTNHQYKSDYFGENNGALTPTMELINIQNQSIAEGVKNSNTFRFTAKYSEPSFDEDLAKEQKRFTKSNMAEGNILLFPYNYNEIKQVESRPITVDAKQMEIIKTNVFNYFGVNEDVLQNKAVGDSWNAFYEGAIEPFAIQLSDVLTKMTFTLHERNGGNKFAITSNRLQYLSNADKLNVSAQMLDRGVMSINDIREIWNLPTVEGGDARIIRGEYYDANTKLEEGDKNNASEEQ